MDALKFQILASPYLCITLLLVITGCGSDYNPQKFGLKRTWEYSDRLDQLVARLPVTLDNNADTLHVLLN